MMTVLLVCADDVLRRRVEQALQHVCLFVATNDHDAIKQLRTVDMDVAVRPASAETAFHGFAEIARSASPSIVLVAMVTEDDDADAADFIIRHPYHDRELKRVLQQAAHKRTQARELDRLRRVPPLSDAKRDVPSESRDSMKLVREFTRVLSAGFDLPRTLETFTDAVVELLRPARLALLLPDAEGRRFRVRIHRGLAPHIAGSIRLPVDSALCDWLTQEGRPARVDDLAETQVAREVALLQGAMAVPLLAGGELVAILVIGPPVVRNAYTAPEVETLFDLATHLASALHTISLHHRLQRASEFRERILDHMSSGVVTICADERISTLNRRGAEILGLDAHATVGQDLRVLPSPLGDMLYETLTSAVARPHTEVRLAFRGLCLEVSSYPVRGDDAAGAVLVFEDRTTQKELAAQKRESEQFDLLTRVIARIADEVKNPLVSINTFVELITERFDDPEFRRHFSAIVGRDVRRLVQVFDKLTGLINQAELNFSTVHVQGVVEEVVAAVRANDEARRPSVDIRVGGETSAIHVKVDQGQLRKALAYLVWYLAHHSPDRAAVSLSVKRRFTDGIDNVRIAVSSSTATLPVSDVDRIFDPVTMVQESLIDIGPAVSQRLVEALGGRLEAQRGSNEMSFLLTLPEAK